jgi:hypothetical protein
MSLHLKAIAASDPFTYSTGVLKCRTGERKGYLFVRKGRKDEHLHYLTLGCELAPLIFGTAPNRSGLFFVFLLGFCFLLVLAFVIAFMFVKVIKGHQGHHYVWSSHHYVWSLLVKVFVLLSRSSSC